MSVLWFVTPAFQRVELTAICLEQRRLVIDALGKAGVEAHQVVIADDENLDVARSFGFDVVERDNEWLGRKFNDGMEYAGKHGAEWIVPIGSDSWIDPAYFLPLPHPGDTRSSSAYCVVEAERMAELRVGRNGAGPYMFNRRILAPSGFRPAADELHKGIDHSTVGGIKRPIRWQLRTLHPFQYIGFRGMPHITGYDQLMHRWGVAEHEPWAILAEYYPADLVDRARLVMEANARELVA